MSDSNKHTSRSRAPSDTEINIRPTSNAANTNTSSTQTTTSSPSTSPLQATSNFSNTNKKIISTSLPTLPKSSERRTLSRHNSLQTSPRTVGLFWLLTDEDSVKLHKTFSHFLNCSKSKIFYYRKDKEKNKHDIAENDFTLEYDFCLHSELPENGIPEKLKIYFKTQENELHYLLLGPKNEPVEGSLTLNLGNQLTALLLKSKKNQILDRLIKNGDILSLSDFMLVSTVNEKNQPLYVAIDIKNIKGQGGTGAVYKGQILGGKKHIKKTLQIDDPIVAIKLSPLKKGQNKVEFENEILMLSKQDRTLRSPRQEKSSQEEKRLIGFYIDESKQVGYLIQEFGYGKTLFDWCYKIKEFDEKTQKNIYERVKDIDPILKNRIIFAIIQAYHELHQTYGIFHGDIKPENIMVNHTEQDEIIIKIVDFGRSCFTYKLGNQPLGTEGFETPENYWNIRPYYSIQTEYWKIGLLCAIFYSEEAIYINYHNEKQATASSKNANLIPDFEQKELYTIFPKIFVNTNKKVASQSKEDLVASDKEIKTTEASTTVPEIEMKIETDETEMLVAQIQEQIAQLNLTEKKYKYQLEVIEIKPKHKKKLSWSDYTKECILQLMHETVRQRPSPDDITEMLRKMSLYELNQINAKTEPKSIIESHSNEKKESEINPPLRSTSLTTPFGNKKASSSDPGQLLSQNISTKKDIPFSILSQTDTQITLEKSASQTTYTPFKTHSSKSSRSSQEEETEQRKSYTSRSNNSSNSGSGSEHERKKFSIYTRHKK